MQQDALNCPPFPLLKWDQYFWAGEIVLPSWAGYQTRRGPYAGVSSQLPSVGSARLTVSSPDKQTKSLPRPEQQAAFELLLSNEATITSAVVRALFDYCLGNDYYSDNEELPDLSGPDDLRTLLGLSSVHVLDVIHDDIACIGFEFGCVWDEEHGAGVMTHLGRVIATGQADCSFVGWIAREGVKKLEGRAAPDS